MKNKALYTKYRPLRFDQVINQEIVVDFLKKSIINNRVNHFYIFSGNKGTGKTTTARIFSKALNCESSDVEPCNECNSCLSNINTFEIDAASNNGVDNIRLLIEKSHQVNISGSYKVFIIDEAHMLTKSAFNAMLKTLEESSSGNVFILATTEIEKIPDTIISRAINLYFNNITRENIETLIKDIAQKEKYEIDDESIKIISTSSNNAARNALVNLQKASIYCNDKIEKNYTSKLFQIADDELINQLYLDLLSGNIDIDAWNEKLSFIQNRFSILLEQLIDLSIFKSDSGLYKYLLKIYEMFLNSRNVELALKMILSFEAYKSESPNITSSKPNVSYETISERRNNTKSDSQNVSRETKEIERINLWDILESATKEDKLIWSKRWMQNSKMIKDKRFMEIILILLESSVVAASKKGIVIVVKKKYAVDKLSKMFTTVNELLKYYSGHDIDHVILLADNWLVERENFLKNKREKNEKKSVSSVFGSDFVEEI